MGSLRKLWRNKREQEHKQADDAPAQRSKPTRQHESDRRDEVGYNPYRDEHLFWLTEDGYIVAQDVVCQYDYVQESCCPKCGGALKIAAHLNRAGQGLSEMVALCQECRARANFIFDISNDVFQTWWAEQLGSLYVKQFDGPPREPYSPD
jgi:hypothetical protein